MRASKRRFCSLSLDSSQILMSWMPPSTMYFSNSGHSFEEAGVLLLRAKAHHILDAEAVIPTAVEDDDLARRREVLHVTLHIHLRLLAIGRRRQRDGAKHAGADPLGQGANGAAFARGVAALEDDDHAQALVFGGPRS